MLLSEMGREHDPIEHPPIKRSTPSAPPRAVDLPYEDGEPVESDRHYMQRVFLRHTLWLEWKERRDFYVAVDMALYFSEIQSKRNDFRAPDLFVVVGAEWKARLSWVVWEEEGRTPDVVIEILSESTEHVDRGEKMRIYARVLKVAEYYLYDPFTHALEGYVLEPRSGDYRRIEPNESGRLPCQRLGLELGLWEGSYELEHTKWLRWFHPTGRLLLTAVELGEDESHRADEESRRADEEARRADEETQRADEEARRAADEVRRADEEARRAGELAKRLAEYERRYGKLDG